MATQIKPQQAAQFNGKVLVAVASYNGEIVSKTQQAFMQGLGLSKQDLERRVTVVKVPGSLELAQALLIAEQQANYSVLVALGCVIKGDTYHFEVVCNGTTAGLVQLSQQLTRPVINGVLTCDNQEQAIERAETKGFEFGQSAATMASLYEQTKLKPDLLDPRRIARIIACQAAYLLDANDNGSFAKAVEDTLEMNKLFFDAKNLDNKLINFFTDTYEEKLDAALLKLSEVSTVELNQIEPLERAILKIAALEILWRTKTPTAVIINEWIEISKFLGAEDSYKFVNAMLEQLHKAAN